MVTGTSITNILPGYQVILLCEACGIVNEENKAEVNNGSCFSLQDIVEEVEAQCEWIDHSLVYKDFLAITILRTSISILFV